MQYEAPWMNDELRILKDAAKKFFEQEFVPEAARWNAEGVVDKAAWRKAGEAGLLCAEMPEAYGGGGGDYRHETVIMEAQLEAGLGGFGNQVHSTIVAPYILRYGTEEQRQRWLPKLASGEWVAAIAMTEPNTGSDLQAVRTTAKKDGNEYVINGSKTYISNGQNADLIIVVAKTDTTLGARGISLLVVDPEEDGSPGRASAGAGTSTRSASIPRTPRSCSSTTCAFPRAISSAKRKERASSCSWSSCLRSASTSLRRRWSPWNEPLR